MSLCWKLLMGWRTFQFGLKLLRACRRILLYCLVAGSLSNSHINVPKLGNFADIFGTHNSFILVPAAAASFFASCMLFEIGRQDTSSPHKQCYHHCCSIAVVFMIVFVFMSFQHSTSKCCNTSIKTKNKSFTLTMMLLQCNCCSVTQTTVQSQLCHIMLQSLCCHQSIEVEVTCIYKIIIRYHCNVIRKMESTSIISFSK